MSMDLIWLTAATGAQLILTICLADLICGLVHWFEDSYGNEHWPVIGIAIIAPNRLHHDRPRAFLENNWWQSAQIQVLAGIAVLALALWIEWYSWQLVLLLVVAVNGNEVHKWAHRSKAENNRLIAWLQDSSLIQSRRHHAQHHRGLRNSHYCPITPWVNPVLDRLRLWRLLEHGIQMTTGIKPYDGYNDSRSKIRPSS
jgi:ubiquitin-conjugating enzyme E2 variant